MSTPPNGGLEMIGKLSILVKSKFSLSSSRAPKLGIRPRSRVVRREVFTSCARVAPTSEQRHEEYYECLQASILDHDAGGRRCTGLCKCRQRKGQSPPRRQHSRQRCQPAFYD